MTPGLCAEKTSMQYENKKNFLNPNISFDLLTHFHTSQWVQIFFSPGGSLQRVILCNPTLVHTLAFRVYFSLMKTLVSASSWILGNYPVLLGETPKAAYEELPGFPREGLFGVDVWRR